MRGVWINMDAEFFAIENDYDIQYSDTLSRDTFHFHFHDACEIIFYIEAKVEVFLKNARYHINSGDIVFIDNYDIHTTPYFNETNRYTRYIIYFKKSSIQNILTSLNINNLFEKLSTNHYAKARINHKRNETTEYFFNKLMSISKSLHTTNDPLTHANFKLFLVQLLLHLSDLSSKNLNRPRSEKKDRQVYNIINFIDENYKTPLNLDVLAEKFHYSKYYMCHIFKEFTSLSIIDYIQYRRIIESQKMLKETTKEIFEICFDCGFNNLRHYYRVFNKVSKLSPMKFRKDHPNEQN